MHIESSVTSVSWIPSEAVTGAMKLPFQVGVSHYDPPPPDALENREDLEELRSGDRFRFANELRAWIEVDDGRVVDYGHAGGGHIGSTTIRLGPRSLTMAAVAYPDLRPEPKVGDGWVQFTQTAGGRTGAPMPRRVNRPPFMQIVAPTAWTTLALTLHVDGRAECELVGASPFPRHWVYDGAGRLLKKSGLIDFKAWTLDSFGDHSPWGEHDAPALVAEVESALERQLSVIIMDGKPRIRKLKAGHTLVEQGERGEDIYLLLDGILVVEVDGQPVTEVGPGAIVGERAALEGGTRTATLRAVTRCRVAVTSPDQLDEDALMEIARGHRREPGAESHEQEGR